MNRDELLEYCIVALKAGIVATGHVETQNACGDSTSILEHVNVLGQVDSLKQESLVL